MLGQITINFDSAEEAEMIIAAVEAARKAAGIAADASITPNEKPAPTTSKKPEKSEKPAPKTEEPEPEDEEEETDPFGDPEPKRDITLETLRELFQDLVKSGKRPEAVKLISNLGYDRVWDVPEDKLAEVYEAAMELRNAK